MLFEQLGPERKSCVTRLLLLKFFFLGGGGGEWGRGRERGDEGNAHSSGGLSVTMKHCFLSVCTLP